MAEAIPPILSGLQQVAVSNVDCIPNPVNPEENFADKWTREDYAKLHLKENFKSWVQQVSVDFSLLLNPRVIKLISEVLNNGWPIDANKTGIAAKYNAKLNRAK